MEKTAKHYELCPLVEGVNVFFRVQGVRVTGLVLSSVLEERFGAAATPAGWLAAYVEHQAQIDEALRRAYEASPASIVILWPFDFPRQSHDD